MEIVDSVAWGQAVHAQHLKPIDKLYSVNDNWLEFAGSFCKEQRCFSNAINTSLVDCSIVVVGYVFLHRYGISIEHAWNRDNEGDFDLTAQLFWPKSEGDDQCSYLELVSFEHNEALEWAERGGVDHFILRKSDEFGHLFRKNRQSA